MSFLVKEAKHLPEPAKTESVEKLRQQVQVLEKNLEEFTHTYESLRQGLTPPPQDSAGTRHTCEVKVQSTLEGKGGGDNTDGAGC